ncbi:MAG: toxin-antitoxin system HicB family antitoxin [Spirochaetia bacterium]|jgi:hypothetical protein|nr:toxin-antitoxin system HicB family antitoxin [Spirochaetia bacterium]
MKVITIRGVEPILSEKLKQAAKEKGKSVNQFIIEMLKENFGLQKKKKYTVLHHDLDNLFGSWSENSFNQIQSKIDNERKIDKELWE